jgi:nitroimidazol reductase NimA-like FMN-containing flavoprotein (pyridoxamine 5'-phosphate oxidase superfamily)
MIQDMGLQESDKLLSGAPFGRLALADGEEPYIVPLSYVFANKTIYFHSWHEGEK